MMWGLFRKEIGDLVRQPRALAAALLYPLLVVPLIGAALDRGTAAAPCLQLFGKAASELGVETGQALALPRCTEAARNRISVEIRDDTVIVDGRDWRGSDRDLQRRVLRMRKTVAATLAPSVGVLPSQAAALASSVIILPKAERTGRGLAAVVPILALFLAALGAVYPSLESGVGERETGTLLGLLQSPLSDAEVVFAKIGAAWVCACIAVGAAGTLGAAWLDYHPGFGSGMTPLTPATLVLGVVLVGIAALPLAAGGLLASLWSRSIREAQQYVMILVAITVLIAGSAVGPETPALSLPIADAAEALTVLLGSAPRPNTPLLSIFLVNGGFALALAGLAIRRMQRLRQKL